jgi:predicted Zn-dependent protease
VNPEDSEKSNKHLGILWVVIAILGALFCAGSLHVWAKQIPWSWETRAAELIGKPPLPICIANPGAQKILGKLMQRIYPLSAEDHQFTISVQVVREDQVNAFASLGGQIFVNSGLLREVRTPEELAAVLAHEIGHVEHRHIIQGAFSEALFVLVYYWMDASSAAAIFHKLMSLPFSRQQEEEADLSAVERLQKANVSVQGMVDFFKRLDKQGSAGSPGFSWEALSDHPKSLERSKMAEKYLRQKTQPIMNETEWAELKKICDQ